MTQPLRVCGAHVIPGVSFQLALRENEKKEILSFFDEKEGTELIAKWLQDWGISPFRAKIVAKLLVPTLQGLLTGTAGRGVERLHELLRKQWNFYDDVTLRIGKWLLFKIEDRRTPKKVLSPHIDHPPSGVSADDWNKINEQTRVWLAQLEKLDLIALALHDLSARVSLQIDRPQRLQRAPLSRLLRPYNAFIDLIGREPELTALNSFCDDTAAFRWKVLTGQGGVGKTRLALELAKTREEAGWNAGFLSAESLRAWVKHDGFPRWSPLADTLVVIDYAAAKTEDLRPLIQRCGEWAQTKTEPTHLRLLLLERQADPDTGWLYDLLSFAEGALRDRVWETMEAVQEITPPGREAPDEVMQMILHAAFEGWARLPGDPPPAVPNLDGQQLRELRRETQGRPLFLQMAALRACAENNASKLTQWGQVELLQDAVARERNYVKRRCDSNSARATTAERGIALLTFTGPIAKNDPRWLKLLELDARACGYPYAQPGEVSDDIAALLSDSVADGTAPIIPLAPDLLAEAFAVTVLRQNLELAVQAIEAALECSGPRAWNSLLRAAVDLHALGKLGVIESWLISLIQRQPRQELYLVEALIPKYSVALAEIAAVLSERQLQVLPAAARADKEQARILNNLGGRYSGLGRREEALGAAERAAEIYERLAKQNPDAFEPDLASSLGTLGRIWEKDNSREAINCFRRGVDALTRLFLADRRTFAPLMATLVKEYLQLCELTGTEADPDLLAPIMEAFKGFS